MTDPHRDEPLHVDAIDGDWIKRGRRARQARQLPAPVADWLAWPESPQPFVRLTGRCGEAFLCSLDGSDDELAPSVVYNSDTGRLSLVHTLAGHARFLHGYLVPFTGSDEEQATIETAVRPVLARKRPSGASSAPLNGGSADTSRSPRQRVERSPVDARLAALLRRKPSQPCRGSPLAAEPGPPGGGPSASRRARLRRALTGAETLTLLNRADPATISRW